MKLISFKPTHRSEVRFLALQVFLICSLTSAIFSGTVSGQEGSLLGPVFGSGPSDANLFATVINVPQNPAPLFAGGGPNAVQLNVSNGGTVPNGLNVSATVEFNVDGGVLGDSIFVNGNFIFNAPAEANISGGTFGINFTAIDALLNLSGGTFGAGFTAVGTEVNLSGGTVFNGATFGGSTAVNIFGNNFLLDGVPVSGLTSGIPNVITTREVPLSGTLQDGSPFHFDLNFNTAVGGGDFFDQDVTVNLIPVAVVPEPTSTVVVALFATGAIGRRRRNR